MFLHAGGNKMRNLGSKFLSSIRLDLKSQTMKEQKHLWEILMLSDVNRFYLTVSAPRENLMNWDIQKEFYKKAKAHANDLDVYKWSIFLKGTDTCIGQIDSHTLQTDNSDPSIRGIGWYIDPQYQKKGYGTEAAKAMIEYLFEKVEIDSILTKAAIDNAASWKIMERLGCQRLPKTCWTKYTFMDEPVECYQYILTKEMYFKQ